MKAHQIQKSGSGFSWIEIIVVVSVVGILAMIAVPNIGTIQKAGEQHALRNAQQLASVCAAAQAAGHNFVLDIEDTEDTNGVFGVVSRVCAGSTIKDPTSPFNGSFFGVLNLTEGEQFEACKHLAVQHGMLVYSPKTK